MILILQALLALAYALLAHLASARDDGVLAVCALAVLVLLMLAAPLAQRRPWAWLSLPVGAVALTWLAGSRYAQLPLLLAPTAFIALVAYVFGRSLQRGRVPLISKIVMALEGETAATLAPELMRYTRRLTAAWAWALGLLAAINLLLALIAVPDGVLAQFGMQAPLTVTQTQWSWFANIFNYGIIAAFFAIEFAIRKHHFPGRYHGFSDFLRRLRALGPAFWRDFLH
ncbi:putative membrane protein [Luteimonas cucumeris]|uniref:Putative membrane protein n=1 Tax=Luteimonas cucumeris TaxID=985012 RepID=A0A562KX01_9GAMM|nr:ketosynthase [Luteimonas cucumeris]TWH99959.1 putative membrane protein [Luteimonas cucumeris]